ncbi:MAG: hypothetical protein FJX48_11430 [Alphaproteobacteria bacterium]|nr:hypothetical protein [Alphaproteobacteria bacterium]
MASNRISSSRRRLDHAAFRRNRPNADDVIDSKSLERALRKKPASTFSQRALAACRTDVWGFAARLDCRLSRLFCV